MKYQRCRWYDLFPKLVFALQLLRLMPLAQQQIVAYRFYIYINNRLDRFSEHTLEQTNSNRWYDRDMLLTKSFSQLKSAPDSIKEQASEFFYNLIQEEPHTHKILPLQA